MKIITHVRPHLDEIMAIWLVENYWPDRGEVTVEFIDNNERPDDVDADPDVLYIGVGRGRFDEHRGVAGECAASLVWQGLPDKDKMSDEERKAIDKLVDWVRDEDLGLHMDEPRRAFTVPAIIDGWYLFHDKNSSVAVGLGTRIIDALMYGQRELVRLEVDWEKRVEFDSRFGRAVALQTDTDRASEFAYQKGFDLAVIMNRAHTYRTIRAKAESPIDLTDVAEAIEKADKAKWFFHHSKRMLILGGDHDPKAAPSSLQMPDLIDLLK